MNINYGDSNLIVRYLQYFLRSYYSGTVKMSDTFDEYTHKILVKYLDMPNLIPPEYIVNTLVNLSIGDNDTPFKDMQYHIDGNTITFHYHNPKSITGYDENNSTYEASLWDEYKSLIPRLRKVYNLAKTYIENCGWLILEYPEMYANEDTDSVSELILTDRSSITVVLTTGTPSDKFPHFDMRYMINYFQNDYVNNVEISSGYFTKSSNYRIALVDCKPGDTFIFSHSYSYSIPIKFGYSSETMNSVKDLLYTSTNNTSINISKVKNNNIKRAMPGTPMLIKVPSDKQYRTILIQLPLLKYTKSGNNKVPLSYNDSKFIVGDLNNDGVIDEIDYLIYSMQKIQNNEGAFNIDYERYSQLCEAVETRYQTMFYSSINNGYGTYGQYNNKEFTTNIDNLIEHLKVIGYGSDITYSRYELNGEVNYKIVLGSQAQINYDTIHDVVFELDEYDTDDGSGDFLLYIQGVYNNKNIKLAYYLIDGDDGYDISEYEVNDGIQITGTSDMTSNSLLVIKTNPSDDITDCSSIISGANNSDNLLSLPISEFKTDPWIIREEFITALLDMLISQYSNEADIGFVHDIINSEEYDGKVYTGNRRYVYSTELRDYIRKLQIDNDLNFSLGYFDPKVYSIIYNDIQINSIAKRGNY